MSSSTILPWRTAIVSFKAAEKMLEDVLAIVPYCPQHENVWSPLLVTVLLEVGSQLDSLWKTELQLAKPRLVPRPDITDYFEHLGRKVAADWLVFWGEEGSRIEPFAAWATGLNYAKSSYQPLPWWQAYNQVKHDRLANRETATLVTAVHALAGLFIAMVRCLYCAEGIAHEEWIPVSDGSCSVAPEQLLGPDPPLLGIIAESKLLSFPTNPNSNKCGLVSSRQSYRFSKWCSDKGVRYC